MNDATFTKKMREGRHQAGLCPICGKNKPEGTFRNGKPRKWCRPCVDDARARQDRRMARIKKESEFQSVDLTLPEDNLQVKPETA